MDDFDDENLKKLYTKIMDPERRCSICEKPCDKDANFCSSCGSKNPRFDEREFVKEWEETLFEAQEECRKGHPEGLALLADYPDQNFCTHCGTDLRQRLS